MAQRRYRVAPRVQIAVRVNRARFVTNQGGDINRLSKSLLRGLDKVYQEYFANSAGITLEDWADSPGAASNILSRDLVSSYSAMPARFKKRMQALYQRAWKKKYEIIKTNYRSVEPEYGNLKWAKYKRKNKGKVKPQYHSKPIKFTSYGLSTGFLRESIRKEFASGGGNRMDLGNLLLQGGYALDFNQYAGETGGQHRYPYFIYYLDSIGVLDDFNGDTPEEKFLDFDPLFWREIANQVQDIISNDFFRGLSNSFNGFLRQQTL